MDEKMTNNAKIFVRIGFIVAGADGLSDEERSFLYDYAVTRSGLSTDEVETEEKAAAAGVSSLSAEDIDSLKELKTEEIKLVLAEIVEKAAAADGNFSESEQSALLEVWGKIDP
jgi:tellurite resistance protein